MMAAPAINPNRKSYSGKNPKDIKKVQWVRIRRSDTTVNPINNPFRYQEDGITKEEKQNGLTGQKWS